MISTFLGGEKGTRLFFLRLEEEGFSSWGFRILCEVLKSCSTYRYNLRILKVVRHNLITRLKRIYRFFKSFSGKSYYSNLYHTIAGNIGSIAWQTVLAICPRSESKICSSGKHIIVNRGIILAQNYVDRFS